MIHILQLSDTHLFADTQGKLYNINTKDNLHKVISHVQKTIDQIDVVMLTGDLVHDETREGYELLKSMLTALDAPTYFLPGNHDDPAIMSEVLGNCAYGEILSIDAGAWSLVLLDSSVKDRVEGELSEHTLQQLKGFLEQSQAKPVLVALHHHIIDVESPWLDALNLRNHPELTALLENFSNVKVVVNGHVHQEIDTEQNGIRYLGTPATCFQFAIKSANGGIDDRPPAYRHIALNDDGSLETTVHYIA